MSSTQEVFFIFLGKKLPSYAVSSLKIASRSSGLGVHLLGNAQRGLGARIESVKFTAIEDFYNPQKFEEAAKRVTFSHSFRDGLWLKSLERLFVLYQYMTFNGMDQIFHAELDQLLFGVNRLTAELDKEKKTGLFLPFRNRHAAVASVLYCNSQASFKSLLEYACGVGVYPNEMVMIAEWAKINPDQAFPLPTLASLILSQENKSNGWMPTVGSSQIGGVVDAAQLGQWIGGVDPRNVSIFERPVTKFVDDSAEMLLSRAQLSTLRFDLDLGNPNLTCTYADSLSVNVYNLHIHSKIHSWILKSDANFYQFIEQANLTSPMGIPTTTRVQVSYAARRALSLTISNPKLVATFARMHLNRLLRRRPSSKPFISGDTFRALADHVWESGNELLDGDNVKHGDVIFCESTSVESLASQILGKLNVPVVLLLGNSDRNITNLEANILQSLKTQSIYAQNLTEPVSGINPLPIGIENAWLGKNGRTAGFRQSRRYSRSRKFRIMWTFSIATNAELRTLAAISLADCPVADYLGDLSPREHRENLSTYAFIASPPGNGIDTHRTWEAMYLGSVPIVIRSHLTEFYKSLGLPIWLLDSYSELVGIDEDQLRNKYVELRPKFDSQALWIDFWADRIKSQTSGRTIPD